MHAHRDVNTIDFSITSFLNKLVYIASIRYIVIVGSIELNVIINTFYNKT
ncbi:Uncharacterised protein [Klebsiella pneumoniae]|uniref:Uncharacterized protein n=2 Tax=Klebsiella pneumoniae TaxID=573 RepID=A0A377ZD38_KLEPO|nr:Uncharacterised protein [Klebsiella pneumoniae]STU66080.1 Uncharacterised protein [Klebsiella pneumoniae subsp. ozaenae]